MAKKLFSTISRRSTFLFLMDLGAVFLSYVIACWYRRNSISLDAVFFRPFLYGCLIIIPFCFYTFDLYYPFKYFKKTQTFIDVLFSVALAGLLLSVAAFWDKTFLISRTFFAITIGLMVPLTMFVRIIYDVLFRSRLLNKRAIVVGSGGLVTEIVSVITAVPHSGIDVLGVVSDSAGNNDSPAPVLGGTDKLISVIDWYNIDLVIVALDKNEKISETQLMVLSMEQNISIVSAIYLYERMTGKISLRSINEDYLLGLLSQLRRNSYFKIKRILDFFLSVCIITVSLPVFLFVSVILFFTEKGDVFFFQNRIGKNGKVFKLYKFKSMSGRKEKKVTGFGFLMRKYRLDEMPQLFNVLKGDMSLVGPRPEMEVFVKRSKEQMPYYDIIMTLKPGLTGWAQLKLDHVTSLKDYEKKFQYNLFYLKNMSVKMDLMILLHTLRTVVLGKGK